MAELLEGPAPKKAVPERRRGYWTAYSGGEACEMTINKWMASKKDGAGAATAFGDLSQRRSVAAAEMNATRSSKAAFTASSSTDWTSPPSPRSPGATLGDHQDRRGSLITPRGFRSHGQSESGWSSRSSTRPLGLDP